MVRGVDIFFLRFKLTTLTPYDAGSVVKGVGGGSSRELNQAMDDDLVEVLSMIYGALGQ